MAQALPSHPDRAAATLACAPRQAEARGAGPFAVPGSGAADCRIDLKLLQWQALAAAERSAAARAHLARFAAAAHPDLWAGTVQDGAARGFAAALEEAIALAPPLPPLPGPPDDPLAVRRFTGKELRKKKDLLVKSGGARVRFSRKEGLLFVDRGSEQHSANCLRFEARRDLGTLDGFAAAADERPRLFSAQFLQPHSYLESAGYQQLELRGRLGRGPIGWPCQAVLTGSDAEPWVRLRLVIEQRVPDYRLRVRFLGLPSAAIAHDCTDVREVVQSDAGGFVAFTLVRACGTLLVDGAPVAVPGAQGEGRLRHDFRLGG